MKNKLVYITYQTFPSRKANTIQTIDNLNYLAKYFDVELIFPLRDKLEKHHNHFLQSNLYLKLFARYLQYLQEKFDK